MSEFLESIKPLLNLAALMLSIVNALILIYSFLKNRAILSIEAIHPENYQWWCKLPKRMKGDENISRIAFLTYVGISNSGHKTTSLHSYRLFIRTTGKVKESELKSIRISEPTFTDAYGSTNLRVFGVKTKNFDGETVIDSGCSIAGCSFFIYESKDDSPIITDRHIIGTLKITDNFHNRKHVKITFSEVDYSYLLSVITNLDKL